MIILDATTKILELLTTAAVNTDYYISYVDITSSAFTPAETNGQITTATTTTILAAPASSTQRQVKYVSIVNRSTATAQTVTVKYDISGTERYITPTITLDSGEQLQYTQEYGWQTFTANGSLKLATPSVSGATGQSSFMYKVGAASEAANVMHTLALSSGFPGAWAPGTPGVAGRTCTGTDTTNDGGCFIIKNASVGRNFLTMASHYGTTTHYDLFNDVLWVNSGLTVTTTTAQTVNSVTLPARDNNQSTNGEGVQAAILVVTATTNAGAITNTTMSYTNSDGTSGRTATIASFPATAVAGTWVTFQLQAGDRGIRSIQSVTLGTSYGGGSISVVMFRNITSGMIGSGAAAQNIIPKDPGVFLASGVCILPVYYATATTATSYVANLTITERT